MKVGSIGQDRKGRGQKYADSAFDVSVTPHRQVTVGG